MSVVPPGITSLGRAAAGGRQNTPNTTNRYRVSPASIGSSNSLPIAITAESPPAQEQYSSNERASLI